MLNRLVFLFLAGYVTTAVHSTSCKNGGMIVSKDLRPNCSCKPGFKGSDCSQRVTPCETSPCRNEGRCSENNDGTFTCTCTALYKGVLCERPVLPCDSGPCKNGGNCTNDGLKCFQCKCPLGFKGSDCSEIVQPCEFNHCGNHGICENNEGGTFKCKCDYGFKGLFCEKRYDLYGSEILKGHPNYTSQLEEWLDGAKPWILCYRASDHGWAASSFHTRCDYKHPIVTIIRTGLYIFGAYSDVPFAGSMGNRPSGHAFIFSFVNKDNLPPFKSPIYRNSHAAIVSKSDCGPMFGGDIRISNNANVSTACYAGLGFTYQPPSGYTYGTVKTKYLLVGTYFFVPNEVETFYLD